jgi:hypothetical protein
MASLANDDGWCNPGQADLAAEMDKDNRTIRRRLELLDRLGLVEKLRRHRRSNQEYQLHVPVDPERMTWRDPVALVIRHKDLTLDHGWFNQDRPQVPGQASMLLDGLAPPLERSTSGSPPGVSGRNQDRTQDRTPVTVRPDTGDSKTGHPRPVPKDSYALDARAAPPITEEEIIALAREKARTKGARNVAALTHRIYTDDRVELLAELTALKARALTIVEIADCEICDDVGRVWRTVEGTPVAYDDPDAATAEVCGHG